MAAARGMIGETRVSKNPSMHPLAWMGYDAEGQIVECGILGKSLRSSQAIAVRIECGSEFYRQLREYVEAGNRLS